MARGASEFEGVNHRSPPDRGLGERCLRVGGIPYPSPSLTAHGFYRLNDSGIVAADGADRPGPLREAPRSEAPAGS
jgi:hypothetical protein